MDQAQTKALAAIQPFVYEATSAKTPTPRYLSDLITRATSAPGTYIFTELLQTSAIQSLKAADVPEGARAYLTLLEIFSWGTLEEYKATPNLPALTPAQEHKLRQLTLLTLASPFGPPSSTTSNDLTYPSLLSALSLPNLQALESLLTTSIYTGLLTARLSPTSNPPTVYVTSVAPLRDLRPQSLPALLSILSTWSSRCESVIADLESQITSIQSSASLRSSVQKKRQDIVDSAVVGEVAGSDIKNTTGGMRLRNRPGNKRDLDESLDAEGEEDGSSDDLRMDLDEGLDNGSVSVGGGSRAGGPAGSSRGSKRGRGRG